MQPKSNQIYSAALKRRPLLVQRWGNLTFPCVCLVAFSTPTSDPQDALQPLPLDSLKCKQWCTSLFDTTTPLMIFTHGPQQKKETHKLSSRQKRLSVCWQNRAILQGRLDCCCNSLRRTEQAAKQPWNLFSSVPENCWCAKQQQRHFPTTWQSYYLTLRLIHISC